MEWNPEVVRRVRGAMQDRARSQACLFKAFSSVMTREQAEARVRQPDDPSQGGEDHGGQHVEQEDHRDGLGDFLIIRLDHRGGGRDGGAAADG